MKNYVNSLQISFPRSFLPVSQIVGRASIVRTWDWKVETRIYLLILPELIPKKKLSNIYLSRCDTRFVATHATSNCIGFIFNLLEVFICGNCNDREVQNCSRTRDLGILRVQSRRLRIQNRKKSKKKIGRRFSLANCLRSANCGASFPFMQRV